MPRRDPFLYRLLVAARVRELFSTAYRIDVAGAERIPAAGPAIIACNHESVIDPFVLSVVTARTVRYMAKAELWRHPALGWAMDALGGFPVERGTGDTGAVGAGLELLRGGELLGVFPQGTAFPLRHRPFHRGAARLALLTGAPLVPVCMIGSERAVRPHRLRLGLPRITIMVARPIRVEPARPTIAAAKALTRRVEEAIGELGGPYGPPAHAWVD